MPPTEPWRLCVSIHDVAPATWPECERLHAAVRAVAGLPITWLVVPRYRGCADAPLPYLRALDGLLARGHELALHGYTHVDDGPAPRTLAERFRRRVLTQGEGEFAALSFEEARRRLDLGAAWFAQHGWPLAGFVAPAWMLGRPAWAALQSQPLRYTSTFGHIHRLDLGTRIHAPTLVYAARNGSGRLISPLACSAIASCCRHASVLRLALHPRDAAHPALLRHAQQLLERLLVTRLAVTEARA